MAHACPIHRFLPVLQHRRCITYNRHEGVCIVSSYLHRSYKNPVSYGFQRVSSQSTVRIIGYKMLPFHYYSPFCVL